MQNYLEQEPQELAASQMLDNARLEQMIHIDGMENVLNYHEK